MHYVCYLKNKENLKEKNYISHIVYAFEDAMFSNWYRTSKTYYKSLSFETFMSKVRTRWLPRGWEKDLARKVRNLKQGNMSFRDFSTIAHQDNLLLKNTKHHLSPQHLKGQIEANLSQALLATYDHYKDMNKDDSGHDLDEENTSPNTDAATCKAEAALEELVQVLIKLDDNVHNRRKEVEDAVR